MVFQNLSLETALLLEKEQEKQTQIMKNSEVTLLMYPLKSRDA